MRSRPPSLGFAVIALSALVLTPATTSWAAPKYTVLHAFSGVNDGAGLWGSLLLDRRGNVYGTTIAGGPKGKGGTAFKLSRQANGTWLQRVLYSFCSQSLCKDGGGPFAGLTFGPGGNLYGTTVGGGEHDSGIAFELALGPQGWTETVLYNFCALQGCKDGGSPQAGLVMDDAGNLFGTASVAFELSPGAGGWKEAVLHHFPSYQGDGSGPYAVILNAKGNLYGETNMGGTSKLCGGGCGTVYELQRVSGGWKDHILHDFGTGGDDMGFPGGALLLDQKSNLYGTSGGGTYAHGAVYRLTRQPDGRWKAAILHSFTGGPGGDGPGGGVVMDAAGNLYGTTVAGGTRCDCGVIYELAPASNGKWTYTVLHSFTGFDGAQPVAQLILDRKGNLYGTTITGGPGGAGVAFEITP